MTNKCAICGGNKKNGETTITIDKGKVLIVFRHVPALICEKCGESWLEDTTSAKLENLKSKLVKIGAEIEIIDFASAA